MTVPTPTSTALEMRTVHIQATGHQHAKALRARWRDRLHKVARSTSRTTRPNPANQSIDRDRCVYFDLPPELRDMVFEYAFSGEMVKVKLEHDYQPPYSWDEVFHMTDHPLNRLMVSRPDYVEAVLAFYKHATFCFRSDADNVRFRIR